MEIHRCLAKVIPHPIILCEKFASEALATHEYLTKDEIAYGTNYLCNLNLPSEKLALVLAMISKKTNTGRFALIFNQDLDNALKVQDGKLLMRLLNGDNYLFEVYDSGLTPEELKKVQEMVLREVGAIRNAIESGRSEITRPCQELYQQCYDQVCLQMKTFPVQSELPNNIYTVDNDETFCFDYTTLIEALAQPTPRNPLTGELFSRQALELLLPRYAPEIKMYKRYLETINKTSEA